ncbi:MAG: 3-oxoacyl-[acyl-carrier-protein] reductase [Puniceicoccales bacterium]|jgi:3-oxoacyl-[acyl-carrier protein] reductase|nr:3-oxoacyl-[acyl-carrier-protein] reductase [Puniceicoccales bacterium]
MSSLAFAGRVAVVTGASRGIGEGIARALARGGAHVVCVSRSMANCSKVSDEIIALGGSAEAMAVDVSDSVEVEKACGILLEKHPAADILVNNAGIIKDAILMRMSYGDWDDVIRTNLSSCFFWLKNLMRPMVQRRWGRIVNMSSIVGKIGNFGQANYAAAKAGLIGLTKSAAKEVASRGICVNAIAPGFISTDMTARLDQKSIDDLARFIPMKRLGSVEDVVPLATFLCSEEARYITGQIFTVDGGMTM